jgi:peptidoglycan/LPS O-acetylase OafA/YrhL
MFRTNGTGRPERAPRRLGQVPGLDGMRGLAVLMVVTYHATSAIDVPARSSGWGEVYRAFDGGWSGVDVFFVLSGFLITAILLDEQAVASRIRFGAFYIRRALRLLPAMYFMLALFSVYCLVADLYVDRLPTSIFAAVTYTTNLFDIFSPRSISPPLGHLWSLAIEEQFYLVWPPLLALAFGLRRRASWVVPGMLALIALIFIARRHASYAGEYWGFMYVRPDFRVDGLLIGALLAQLWVRGLTPRRGVAPLAWLGAIGMALMWWNSSVYPDSPLWYRGGETLFALCVACVVLGAVERRSAVSRGLEHPALRFLGRYSYAIYLWHFPIFYVVRRWLRPYPIPLRLGAEFAFTAVAVALSWVLVERPALRLKRRWEVRDLAPRPADGGPDLPVSGHLPPAAV